MKKPKKITVKFFLNKNLHTVSWDNDWGYPLYTQITYDRKNTQIKCTYGWFYKTIEQVKQDDVHLLPFEEKVLKRTVEHELSIHGDEFKLKGLGKKYDHYSLSIHALFNTYLKMRLKDMLKQAEPAKFLDILHIDKPKVDFFVLYEASQCLFDNFDKLIHKNLKEEMDIYQLYHQLYADAVANTEKKYLFPVVIDWLDGSHLKKLAEQFDDYFKQDKAMVTKALDLIDKIIQTKLQLG